MRRLSLALLRRTLLATAVSLSLYPAASVSSPAASASAGDPESVLCAPGTSPAAEAQEDLVAGRCAARAGEDDRAYLLETASPGDTMTRQGPELAIARLNPEFVAKLASAIRDARASGLPSAGVFSAYRPPGFGVGGFGDKFKSLHSYGLAVDMTGIGDPGSKDAKLWHEIAARHGVFCPYGFESKTEWNHCQATPMKSIVADNPLRKTITAQGPVLLEEMFKVGLAVIKDRVAAVSDSVHAIVHAALGSASERGDRRPAHEVHIHHVEVVAHVTRKDKGKMLASALDVKSPAKSHRKPTADPKAHDVRKASRTAESHHEPSHHHSHVA